MFRNKSVELEVTMPEAFKDLNIVCKSNRHKKDHMKPRHLETMHNYNSDISMCYSMIEMQKQSIVVRCWQDWSIMFDKDTCNFQYPDPNHFRWESQPAKSFCEEQKINIVKVTPPIFFKTKEPVNFAVMPSPFKYTDFNITSGIVSYDIQNGAACFIYLPQIDYTRTVVFKLGDPLYHLVPLTERKVKLKFTYDDEAYMKCQRNSTRLVKNNIVYRMRNYIKKAKDF